MESRVSSKLICVVHAISSFHPHFFYLKRYVPGCPSLLFPPDAIRPDEASFCNVTVCQTKHPGPHVRISCTGSVILTLTTTHRCVPVCVSPAKSIPHCSARAETKTNKSLARSEPTDGKCGSMQVIISKNDFGSKKSKHGSMCLIEKACKEIWEF